MKKTIKRSVLSLVLVLVFAISCMPMMAFAADDIIVSTGAELDAALKTAIGTESISIVLANDIDAIVSATYTGYTTGASITIDGQGHKIDGLSVQDTGLRFGARSQQLTLNIKNTVFANMQNNDRNGGGAIALWNGVVNISNGTFTGNVSTVSTSRGGGGVMVQTGSANITNSTFTGNTAEGNGGAIYAGSGRLENVTVTENHSVRGVGGVNGAFTLIKSTVENNTTDSATANPNVSANIIYATNALGLATDTDVTGYGIAGISLIANFALDKVNLVEATIKYSPAQVTVDGAVAVDGATIKSFDVDPVKGLINIVVGITGAEAIANNGPASIVDVLLTSICTDDSSYVSVESYAVYAAGDEIMASLSPDTIIAAFKYASKFDVNGDGEVDAKDLSLALYRFGAIAEDENWTDVKSADINADGVVDMLDITMLLGELYE